MCDIGLPGTSGFEVARAFRADESLKGVYLVALSGDALPRDLQQAAEPGFQRHLAKPATLKAPESLLADLGPVSEVSPARGSPGGLPAVDPGWSHRCLAAGSVSLSTLVSSVRAKREGCRS